MKLLSFLLITILPSLILAQHFEYNHLIRELRLYSPSDTVPSIHFRNTSNGADWILRHDGPRFHIQSEVPEGSEKFTIHTNGNIGIGTTSPDQKLHVVGKARITEMDTLTDLSANVVRQADGTLAIRKYEVGDIAHGGIVFWVDETGEHGLVCSESDLEYSDDFFHQWSTALSLFVTGATGGTVADGSVDGKGAGAMNTMLIVSADRLDPDSAARLCADLLEGGYGDWYLPSKGELHLMYTNLLLAGLGGFVASNYWSSTENADSLASIQLFSSDIQQVCNKSNHHRVRAIRAF